MKLRVAAAARFDLRRIAEYTDTEWGDAQTAVYLAKIRAAFEEIRLGVAVPLPRADLAAGLASLRCRRGD